MHDKTPCVYILASKRNGTFYIGVTSNLADRVYQHKQNLIPGFTSKHDVRLLVYYELYQSMDEAIRREKQIKRWKRKYKLEEIEKINPN